MTRPRKLALLTLLYVVQGMPFGFQALALPLYLAEAGASLETTGLAGLLAAPWLLKALWAPAVERTGRRRPWVIAMQLALLALCAAAAASPPGDGLARLALIVFLMNLVTATQDIAVDGIAVDLLEPRELGPGNSVQVGGYKVGMMLSGGLVVALSGTISWAAGFALMGAVVVLALAAALLWREPAPAPRAAAVRDDLGAILRALIATVRLPGQLWVLAVIATYKLGESMADVMWKQYVLRVGEIDKAVVGLWLTVGGMIPSILGSIAGGLVAARVGPTTAIAAAAVLRAVAVSVYATIALLGVTDLDALVAASWFEEAAGGALTTAMFAFMMSQVDARIGATHYTVLATVEVLGKMPGGLASGFVARHAGFAACFAIAAVLSIAYLPLLRNVRRAAALAGAARARS